MPVISSIYGPLLSVRLLSHARQIHCVPSSTVFTARYGGWQRVANRHLHRDTTRQQNRTVIFQPYMRLERAHFYSEKCPLRRSSPLCSKCRWRWGKQRRPVCRDQTPPLHPAGRRSDALHPFHCRVGPPQEMTRRGVAVIDAAGNFQCRPVRAQGETCHHL